MLYIYCYEKRRSYLQLSAKLSDVKVTDIN